MTDLEKLKALLDEWGVPYSEEVDGERIMVKHGNEMLGSASLPQSDKVTGYHGFFTEYVFAGDGSFVRVGAWE